LRNKAGISEDFTAEETANHLSKVQNKNNLDNSHNLRISSNSGVLGGIDLAFKSGPQAKIFQMYSLLDKVMP